MPGLSGMPGYYSIDKLVSRTGSVWKFACSLVVYSWKYGPRRCEKLLEFRKTHLPLVTCVMIDRSFREYGVVDSSEHFFLTKPRDLRKYD